MYTCDLCASKNRRASTTERLMRSTSLAIFLHRHPLSIIKSVRAIINNFPKNYVVDPRRDSLYYPSSGIFFDRTRRTRKLRNERQETLEKPIRTKKSALRHVWLSIGLQFCFYIHKRTYARLLRLKIEIDDDAVPEIEKKRVTF